MGVTCIHALHTLYIHATNYGPRAEKEKVDMYSQASTMQHLPTYTSTYLRFSTHTQATHVKFEQWEAPPSICPAPHQRTGARAPEGPTARGFFEKLFR